MVKYGETSIICDIYTEEVGLQSYIINGVRKRNARYPASLFQPMYIVEIEAYDNPRKDLNRIKEIRADLPYASIPFDVRKSAIGIFALEVFRKSIREREANSQLFDFVYNFYAFLDQVKADYYNCHLWFVLHLTQYLGFLPAGTYNEQTPYFDIQTGEFVPIRSNLLQLEEWVSSDIFALLHLDLEDAGQIDLNAKSRNRLVGELIRFYQYHIEGMSQINAHQILSQVFS